MAQDWILDSFPVIYTLLPHISLHFIAPSDNS